ncbi:MAG: hypothetical protein M1825_006177 [Sarcosagium campestre]|nr:MAG: hypothetical protein M1825_006177 [Sarcosagium campestre]
MPEPFVAHVEINRPDKLNSFFEAMWCELRTIFNQLSDDPSIRSIVLSGAGSRAFTTGLDVQAASQSGPLASTSSSSSPPSSTSPDTTSATPRDETRLDSARRAFALRRHVSDFQDSTICVLHGYTYGLGIDLSTAADIRYAAADTRFAVKEVDIGLAADIGTLSRLPKVVGNASWVKEVCLSARTFGAEEALAQGLVSKVFSPAATAADDGSGGGRGGGKAEAVREALKTAVLLASKSPVAVQGTKELLNYSRDHSVEEGLRYTAVWNAAMLQTDDVQEAMQAGLLKKTPRFEKL